MKHSEITPGFADYILSQRTMHRDVLATIDAAVDWEAVRQMIATAYTRGNASTGRPGYDGLTLFKMELLRIWYGLSNGEIEDLMNDRISFSKFAGLGMDDHVPDRSTLGRFRRIVVKAGIYNALFEEVASQLASSRIYVQPGRISDVRLTKHPVKPRRRRRRKVSAKGKAVKKQARARKRE